MSRYRAQKRLMKDYEEITNDPPYVDCFFCGNNVLGDQCITIEYGRFISMGCDDIGAGRLTLGGFHRSFALMRRWYVCVAASLPRYVSLCSPRSTVHNAHFPPQRHDS